ncbi:MAG: aspartate carbamoyltransferase regulatory subunit [Candidatus Magasanikbacteria bacterium CG10_big_fil_rev_8_21_14_0_10_40_10]|uniref:Aspartate carbamoyltransferase regulatory chain n=1 Tax=Candidatus Magasanikbacteria bacterium CG10_big_fil_rev_8_21_14_0_10_40_10 TaxID=1974648 RepID=A0A2M6W3Y5_9BACT|nr:MAG: aspartate carbamoyltransferase regulatory subunit [Candidatus Magasanikbacteria bacterium CG10_big_fil_rev_8_21_14_0_10_40_10]
MRAFRVFAIEEGTVIDHIDNGVALKIIRLLNLAAENKIVSVGLNFSSRTQKYKDIIKVEKRELTPEEMNRVAILAPHATINIIRDYKVHKKFRVEIPQQIEHVIVCPNPKCVTNHDGTDTVFSVISRNHSLKLQCHYCEKIFKQEEIKEYKNN